MTTIQALEVFPVKGCRGVRVDSWGLSSGGLDHDRLFCIVDEEGHVGVKNEAVSQRKCPSLAKIVTSFVGSPANGVALDAEDMPQLVVPLDDDSAAYESSEAQISSSGISDSTGEKWRVGAVSAKRSEDASRWLTVLLNREDGEGRLHGGTRVTRFGLYRCAAPLRVADYEAFCPLVGRLARDYDADALGARRFAEFGPLSLVNARSVDAVGLKAARLDGRKGPDEYPVAPFRANLVVGGQAKAFTEESWASVTVVRDGRVACVLQCLKPIPRCSVASRNQETGAFVFPKNQLKLYKVLTQSRPSHVNDPECGPWAGPFFGVYLAPRPSAAPASLQVGDVLLPAKSLKSIVPFLDEQTGALVWSSGLLTGVAVALVGFLWVLARPFIAGLS